MPLTSKPLLLLVFMTPLLAMVCMLILYTTGTMSKADMGLLGDFLGGTLNPLIGFLALTSIALASSIATRQLSDSSIAAIDAKNRHTEALVNSNALSLLHAFSQAVNTARAHPSSEAKGTMQHLLQMYASLAHDQLAVCASSIAGTWGGVARCYYLLDCTSNESPFVSSVREAAIATLAIDELEYLAVSLTLVFKQTGISFGNQIGPRAAAGLSAALLSLSQDQQTVQGTTK